MAPNYNKELRKLIHFDHIYNVSKEILNQFLIQNLPINIFIIDKNGYVCWANDRLLKHVGATSLEEVKGLHINKWDTCRWNYCKKVIKNLKEFTQEEEYNGTYYLSTRKPIIENGKVIGVLGVSIDISENKRAKIAKTEFLENMSHDIRTPITGILGLTQDLLNAAQEAKLSTDDISNDFIETVHRDTLLLQNSTNELLEFFNEILEVLVLQSGKRIEHLKSFDVCNLLKHHIELLKPVAQHKKLDLSFVVDKRIPSCLKGIRIYLDRILLNLIGNGLKFTKIGGVKITIEPYDNSTNYKPNDEIILKITVEDTGIGIPENRFDSIFEHFSRLTPSYQGIYKGAGLGLYIVKRYVESMAGEIKVESELGKGTRFILKLPFKVARQMKHQKKYSLSSNSLLKKTSTDITLEKIFETTSKKKGTTLNVLLVEDNHLAAAAAALALKALNCSVIVAENGMKAIEKALKEAYDLVLMDIGLPDINGIDVTKHIRQFTDKEKAKVPIIALTGHADNVEQQKKCFEVGMQSVLSKPLTPKVAKEIINTFISHKSLEKTKNFQKKNRH